MGTEWQLTARPDCLSFCTQSCQREDAQHAGPQPRWSLRVASGTAVALQNAETRTSHALEVSRIRREVLALVTLACLSVILFQQFIFSLQLIKFEAVSRVSCGFFADVVSTVHAH